MVLNLTSGVDANIKTDALSDVAAKEGCVHQFLLLQGKL
jgi:hypothetical protein